MAGRILVLDDEENYAEMLRDLLREHGYRVDMSTQPERAIKQLEEIPYDLVISDYKMPVMDGADLLQKARALYPDLPFILVSGLMNTPELVKVANMSVTLVMEKPLNTELFLRHVSKFTEPMTAEERAAYARESTNNQDGAIPVVYSYPEEPSFFSAGCIVSKEFMDELWSKAKDARSVLVCEPEGGDGELALKDLSVWRGNEDRPLAKFKFGQFVDLGLEGIQSVCDDTGFSNLILVQLRPEDSANDAIKAAASIGAALTANTTPLIACLLSGTDSGKSAGNLTEKNIFEIPPLCERPVDAANYARRFARLFSDRAIKPKCAEFTPEATYEVLAHDWPGNYREIQNVISRVILMHENEALSYPLLSSSFSSDKNLTTCEPISRMENLLRRMQGNYLKQTLKDESEIHADIVEKLEFSSEIPADFELFEASLIRADLGKL